MGFAFSARRLFAGRRPAAGAPQVPVDVSTARLNKTLEHSVYLLNYAVESGIDVEPEIADSIIEARRGGGAVWDKPNAGVVLSATAKLAAKVHPVTGETLRNQEKIVGEVRRYTIIAAIIAALLVPLSTLAFILSGVSSSIGADVKTANDLVVTLHTELSFSTGANGEAKSVRETAPPDALTNLQQLAMLIRSIERQTQVLDEILLRPPASSGPHANYELPQDLGTSMPALTQATVTATGAYQSVRSSATAAQNFWTLDYAAIAACVLPILYALLGACAFLLRLFSQELNTGQFSPSYAIAARFSVAFIGGMIVGLFGNVMQGISLPPLGIAFLVGYGSDVFFSFLESLLQNFRAAKPAGAAPPAAEPAGAGGH